MQMSGSGLAAFDKNHSPGFTWRVIFDPLGAFVHKLSFSLALLAGFIARGCPDKFSRVG